MAGHRAASGDARDLHLVVYDEVIVIKRVQAVEAGADDEPTDEPGATRPDVAEGQCGFKRLDVENVRILDDLDRGRARGRRRLRDQ
jgi:hypothetical protein